MFCECQRCDESNSEENEGLDPLNISYGRLARKVHRFSVRVFDVHDLRFAFREGSFVVDSPFVHYIRDVLKSSRCASKQFAEAIELKGNHNIIGPSKGLSV